MEQYTGYLGFDVSAETIVIAEAHPGRDRARNLGTIPYRLDSVAQWVRANRTQGPSWCVMRPDPRDLELRRWHGFAFWCDRL